MKTRSWDVEECYDQLILWVPLFLSRHQPCKKRSLRLLSNQSFKDEKMFCINLVRKSQTCPIGVSPCSFTAPCSQSVYTFISFMYLDSSCLKRSDVPVAVNLIVIGHPCRTEFFHCWSRFKRLQTANLSQRLPQPKYHCHNTISKYMAPTIQLQEIDVYLLTLRDERPPTVNIRHRQRKMPIIHLMWDIPALGPLHLPTIKIGLSCCKCHLIFARWAGSFKSHHVPRVRPILWTKRAVLGLENTSATWTDGCTPNCINFVHNVSLPAIITKFCQSKHQRSAWHEPENQSENRWNRSRWDSTST